MQESAQLLSGPDLASVVLQPLLHGVPIPSKTCGLLNMTPYDAHVEKVCMKWQAHHGMDAVAFKTFSSSPHTEAVLFSERLLATHLLQDIDIGGMDTRFGL